MPYSLTAAITDAVALSTVALPTVCPSPAARNTVSNLCRASLTICPAVIFPGEIADLAIVDRRDDTSTSEICENDALAGKMQVAPAAIALSRSCLLLFRKRAMI